jgi:putative membrane protein
MTRLLSLGFLAALLALPFARATADDKGTLSKGDRDFVNEAATGGMLEVKLGQLAMDNSSNADVKKFGERMVADHSKANKELKEIADKKGVACPRDLEAKQQQELDRMAKMKGADFDREYVQLMVKDHKDDVAAFENQAKNGQDKDLKEFANKTLPTIREHLGLIQTIAGKGNK